MKLKKYTTIHFDMWVILLALHFRKRPYFNVYEWEFGFSFLFITVIWSLYPNKI